MTNAISGWNNTLHNRIGMLFCCSAFLFYYVVQGSSQRWRQSCTQSIKTFYSVQVDSSTKHTARVKPSQYIAQHLYKQKRKSNCSSCSSQMSYLTQSRSSNVFTAIDIFVELSFLRYKVRKILFLFRKKVNLGVSLLLA